MPTYSTPPKDSNGTYLVSPGQTYSLTTSDTHQVVWAGQWGIEPEPNTGTYYAFFSNGSPTPSVGPNGWSVSYGPGPADCTLTVPPDAAIRSYGLTYSLNPGGEAYQTLFNVVPLVPTLTASSACVCVSGSTTLTWNAPGSTQVVIDHGVGTFTAQTGSRAASPSAATTYTLTATYPDASTKTASVTVTVSAPPAIASFSLATPAVQPGGVSSLMWSVSGAASVSIDQGLGAVPPTGRLTVMPPVTTTYTLTAVSGCCAVTASATLTVLVPFPPPAPCPPPFDPASVPVYGFGSGWEVAQRRTYAADYRRPQTPCVVDRDSARSTQARELLLIALEEWGSPDLPPWLQGASAVPTEPSLLRALYDVADSPLSRRLVSLLRSPLPWEPRRAFYLPAQIDPQATALPYSSGDSYTDSRFPGGLRLACSLWDLMTAWDPCFLPLDDGSGYLIRNLDPVSVSGTSPDDYVCTVPVDAPSLSDSSFMPPALSGRRAPAGFDLSGGTLRAGGPLDPAPSFGTL